MIAVSVVPPQPPPVKVPRIVLEGDDAMRLLNLAGKSHPELGSGIVAFVRRAYEGRSADGEQTFSGNVERMFKELLVQARAQGL